MTTPPAANPIGLEPEEAPAAKPASDVPAALAQLPTQLRLQQYPSHFREYENTWEFSARRQGLLQEGALSPGRTLVGALVLRPFLFDFTSVGLIQAPELHFTPQLVWFGLRPHTPLKRLMLALAKAADYEPGRLYFYYRGAQVNPQSTAAQVSRPPFSSALPLLASSRLSEGAQHSSRFRLGRNLRSRLSLMTKGK